MNQRKRILYLLDYGTVDTDALRLVESATGEREHEIVGLYVEDEDLHRAASLPGMAEISFASRGTQLLEQQRLQQALEAQAKGIRSSFERTAHRFNLTCSFQVVRGKTVEVLLEAASQSDLVMITRPLRSAGLRTRDARQFVPLMHTQRSVLFVNEPWSSGTSIIFLYDASDPAADTALATARRLAATESLPLIVASQKPPTAEQANERHVYLPAWEEAVIVELCEREDARLLVLTDEPDWRELVPVLAERLSCSLLRVGQ